MTKKLEEDSRLFLENKYTATYWKIISNARIKGPVGYKERHHVIPKSMGGSDDPENLVDLSLRQHFICHRLLTKMTTGKSKKSMTFAAWRMATGMQKKNRRLSSHTYKLLRENARDALLGHKNYLISHSEESKQKIKEYQFEKHSKMTKEETTEWVMRSMNSPESWSKERREKISRSTTGKKKTRTEQFYRSKDKTRTQRTERMIKEAKKNKGKTWKVIDGKRVWMEKQHDPQT